MGQHLQLLAGWSSHLQEAGLGLPQPGLGTPLREPVGAALRPQGELSPPPAPDGPHLLKVSACRARAPSDAPVGPRPPPTVYSRPPGPPQLLAWSLAVSADHPVPPLSKRPPVAGGAARGQAADEVGGAGEAGPRLPGAGEAHGRYGPAPPGCCEGGSTRGPPCAPFCVSASTRPWDSATPALGVEHGAGEPRVSHTGRCPATRKAPVSGSGRIHGSLLPRRAPGGSGCRRRARGGTSGTGGRPCP